MRKCKRDLQKVGKEVKYLESELQNLKRQQDFSSSVRGLRSTLADAEFLKAWTLANDPTNPEDPNPNDEEPKDEGSKEQELVEKESKDPDSEEQD